MYVGKHKMNVKKCRCDKRLAAWGLAVKGKAKAPAQPAPTPPQAVPAAPAAIVAASGPLAEQKPVSASGPLAATTAAATAPPPQTPADAQAQLFAHVVERLGGKDKIQGIISSYLKSRLKK